MTSIPDESPFLGHSANNLGKQETVIEHVQRVASLAEAFTAVWGAGWEGRAAGMLHDLGKYGELFQGVLQGTERKVDHSTPGALALFKHYRQPGFAAALAVQGHHGGLQCANPRAFVDSLRLDQPRSDGRRVASTNLAQLIARYEADGGVWPAAGPSRMDQHLGAHIKEAAMLDARMLFSALVDADYLATEAHFNEGATGYQVRAGGPPLEPVQALERLLAHVARLSAASRAAPELLQLRNNLMQACLATAWLPPGLFTLTAPTGAGKTLAMMAFALRHASDHNLRRVIVVLPYLSIIEQSAAVYEDVFKDIMPGGYVLQDHSLAGDPGGDPANERDLLRLAAQNWDAPVIVTTTVRFFESLFANRPTDCRKLHNLARSVIMFDETQTMPVSLAVPTLAALSHLSSAYGSSVLFSTATQPAFEEMYTQAEQERQRSVVGWQPREIAGPHLRLFERARRVRFAWPEAPITWEALAERIADEPQALVIVNLRRHAAYLFDLVHGHKWDGTYHLSTNMCPAHRLNLLATVRERLRDGRPCRLISTQCVEAGVDLDFPEVWRALGPLDAIAQAAGRCNREGRRSAGTVHVFRPPVEHILYPSSEYEHATLVLETMLKERGALDLHDTATVHDFYIRYFTVDRPEKKINPDLQAATAALDFVGAAESYHWIEKQGANVLVPYEPRLEEFTRLAGQARAGLLDGKWVRAARPLAVSVRGRFVLRSITEEVLQRDNEPTGWRILLQASSYDKDTGLNLADVPGDDRYVA